MTSAERLRWEWTLENGARLSAELDPKSGEQQIRQGIRLLSSATSKEPKTHDLLVPAEPEDAGEALHAAIDLDPRGPFCVLRVDGFEVAPQMFPTRRSAAVPTPPTPVGGYLLGGLLLIAAGSLAAYFLVKRDVPLALDAAHRAPSGLFVAHHPSSMTLRKAVVPSPLEGIVLSDASTRETIVIAAYRLDEGPGQDGWTLQQRLGDEVLANLPKDGAYQERERHDDKCLGGIGASTSGALPGGARVWTCAAVRDGRGYLVAISLPDPPVDLPRLRAIVDATELTNLSPARPLEDCVLPLRHSSMRYVAGFLLMAACSSDSAEPVGAAPPVEPGIEAGTTPTPVIACGDAEDLPAGYAATNNTLASSCVAVTPLEDGIVRLRYDADARGSLATLDKPTELPLRYGRRGPSTAVICTPTVEIAVTDCKVSAKDNTTGATLLEDDAHATNSLTRLSPLGERFYGLGLHTGTKLDLRGQSLDLFNTDAFDDTAVGFRPDANPVYESIPFYAALRDKTAYGVFTDNTHHLHFDLAHTDPGRIGIEATGGGIDQYLIAGPSLREVMRRYTRLTGRVPLPAPWATGFMQSRWEGPCDATTTDRPFCNAAGIGALVRKFRAEKIPLDGVFLDIQHMSGFRSFTFDSSLFPNPDAFVADIESQGVHVSTILDPGLKTDPGWDVYDAALAGGHLLMDGTTPFAGQVWPGAAVFPDFSAKKTRVFWSDQVAKVAAHGVRGMWIDMNEPSNFVDHTVPETIPADGNGRPTTMAEVHDVYAYFEAQATFDGLSKAHPTERPFILSRAAFAGQQKWSAVWTGDAPSTFTTLGMTVPQLLGLGMSGMTFAGSDVGGYSGRADSTPELFSRWMAVGAISPMFRAHAEKDARRQEPWSFGPDTEDAVRVAIDLRYSILPYLYSVFAESHDTGAPVLRPLVFEFQDDDASQTIADEAMLGSSLLAAPVTAIGAASRDVYLPPGRWFELRSGAVYEGGRTISVAPPQDTLPFDALPLFAREGAIIPRVYGAQKTSDVGNAALVFDVFPGATKSTFAFVEDDGKVSGATARTDLSVLRTATGARFEAAAKQGTWSSSHAKMSVRLRSVDHVPSAVTIDGKPAVFAFDALDRSITVTLPDNGPFVLEATYDPALGENGNVAVPIRVHVPAGTPDPIAVASSSNAWAHVTLTRAGDLATGTLSIPRAGWAFFKITRGSFATVEKDASCNEITNRHAFGTAGTIDFDVKAFADRCP